MDMSKFYLTGKVAIVTGAGRGIGRAIALGFAQAGADVVVAARTVSEIEDTAAKVRGEGRRALAVPTDVRKVDQVTNMLHKTLESFGRVDILVNNAGGGGDERGSRYVLDLSFETWRKDIELNLESVFICTKIVGEVMVKQRTGSIINISSGMGLGPFPGNAPSAAAKAGVNNFTGTMAQEWGQYNIRVNAILPGMILTPLTAEGLGEDSGGRGEFISKMIPLGRIGEPDDIAAAAIFLASDASSFVSGELIYVSGGLVNSIPLTKIMDDKKF